MRNNLVVALSDLCMHYTALVGSHIPRLAACLADSHSLVRRQALALLANLLNKVGTFTCIASVKCRRSSESPMPPGLIVLAVSQECMRAWRSFGPSELSCCSGLQEEHKCGLPVQDFVKWRGALFHRFVAALVDECPDVRSLAGFLLSDALASKARLCTCTVSCEHCLALAP